MKLGLELAFEPALTRVQALELRAQALVQVRAQAQQEPQVRTQLEPQVQALMQVAELARPELQVQVQLELEQHLQQSHPKPQLHRHRCKVPDRSQEPQLELLQTRVHPKALDMTPRVLVLALKLQVAVLTQAPELELAQKRAAQLALELDQPAQQELLVQELELEPAPGLHVFLERLPLRQGSTQHI